ncbi:hypothetical protein [Sinorhizobium psoraleae]|uniref:Uncharacterized protein n=1 Tax=Sinorhizobium psoraleae TaxID=520838 RepID=A0ABT4KA38_9HYPH|nr:hypothetical protein [Sinorhizobium psoraleae]MCZ4088833.1 hypothetical protein [Sinorhizobium psoraleae]
MELVSASSAGTGLVVTIIANLLLSWFCLSEASQSGLFAASTQVGLLVSTPSASTRRRRQGAKVTPPNWIGIVSLLAPTFTQSL